LNPLCDLGHGANCHTGRMLGQYVRVNASGASNYREDFSRWSK
jgi:hypothetical protein